MPFKYMLGHTFLSIMYKRYIDTTNDDVIHIFMGIYLLQKKPESVHMK